MPSYTAPVRDTREVPALQALGNDGHLRLAMLLAARVTERAARGRPLGFGAYGPQSIALARAAAIAEMTGSHRESRRICPPPFSAPVFADSVKHA